MLEEVTSRYAAIGGSFPADPLDARAGRSAERVLGIPVFLGMRNWHPFVQETMEQVRAAGVDRLACVCLAPQYSEMSVGLYMKHAGAAAAGVELAWATSYHDEPLLIEAFAERLQGSARQGAVHRAQSARAQRAVRSRGARHRVGRSGAPRPHRLGVRLPESGDERRQLAGAHRGIVPRSLRRARRARSGDRARSASSAITWRFCTISTCCSATTPRTAASPLTRPESLNGSPTFTAALAEVVKRCVGGLATSADARVVIIGGGISGLATAYYLAKGGASSTIIESRPRLGGVIQTEKIEGCTIEAGPDSFLSVKPAAHGPHRRTGLRDDVIGSNDHLRITYVRKGGKLVPLPDGLMMMVPTKILPLLTTGLLSTGTKIRMGMELLRAPKMKPGDESVADFVREHYGQEAVDYLAEPLLSGIYGGDPRELSVTAVLPRFVELATRYGSLTRGVLASRAQAPKSQTPAPLFRTLKGGLGQLVDARRGVDPGQGRRCARRAPKRWSGRPPDSACALDGEWLEADRLVVACEAHSGASLLAPVDARLAELMGKVAYSSSMTVAVGFDAADFASRPSGSASWCPRKSAGAWWRAPGSAPSSRIASRKARSWRAASSAAWKTRASWAKATKR